MRVSSVLYGSASTDFYNGKQDLSIKITLFFNKVKAICLERGSSRARYPPGAQGPHPSNPGNRSRTLRSAALTAADISVNLTQNSLRQPR